MQPRRLRRLSGSCRIKRSLPSRDVDAMMSLWNRLAGTGQAVETSEPKWPRGPGPTSKMGARSARHRPPPSPHRLPRRPASLLAFSLTVWRGSDAGVPARVGETHAAPGQRDSMSSYVDDEPYERLRAFAADSTRLGRSDFGSHRTEVEPLILHEARLLDDGRYREWLDLYTDEAIYWIPLSRFDDPATT